MTIKRSTWVLIVAVVAALGGMAPVAAHHSHGNYIRSDWTYLQGTVRQIHWMNPHSWIYLEVQDTNGEAQIWALEGASVVTLRRDGWTPDSVRAGDTLSVRCNPLKDGSRGCLLGFILSEDGEEKEFD